MISVDYLVKERSGPAPAFLMSLLGMSPSIRAGTSNFENTGGESVILSRNAEVAIRGLTIEDQHIVESAIHRLRISPTNSLKDSSELKRTSIEGAIYYLIKAGRLRVLVMHRPDHKISVEDVFHSTRVAMIVNNRS